MPELVFKMPKLVFKMAKMAFNFYEMDPSASTISLFLQATQQKLPDIVWPLNPPASPVEFFAGTGIVYLEQLLCAPGTRKLVEKLFLLFLIFLLILHIFK